MLKMDISLCPNSNVWTCKSLAHVNSVPTYSDLPIDTMYITGLGNDRFQYFNKFGFGSVSVFKILRKSVTVRLRFTSCKKTAVSVPVSVPVSVSEKSWFLVRLDFIYFP